MVFLVLVVVWVLALTPYALKKVGERQVSSELDRFRRGLGALRNFAPECEELDGHLVDGEDDEMDDRTMPAGLHGTAARPHGIGYRPSSRTVMRRRRVVSWLAVSLVASFVLGAVPWFRAMWDLSIVVLLVTAAYLVALAVVQRQAVLAAERARQIVRLRAVRGGLERAPRAAEQPRRLGASRFAFPAAAPAAATLVAVGAAAAGGSRGGERPVVVSLPRRPAFVLVEAPS